MTPENFVYWLQGYFEINDAAGPSTTSITPGKLKYLGEAQLQVIKDHLKLVLEKKTPTWIPVSNSWTGSLLPHTTGVRINPDPDPYYYRNFNSPVPPASC